MLSRLLLELSYPAPQHHVKIIHLLGIREVIVYLLVQYVKNHIQKVPETNREGQISNFKGEN